MSIDNLNEAKKEYDDYMAQSRLYEEGDSGEDKLKMVLRSVVFKIVAIQSLLEGLYNHTIEQEKKNESK